MKFVKDFSEGKVLPLVKKETSPFNRAPGYIIPLNSDSFEQITMDKGLDVIVLFYTSNPCKLCEDLWPFYIQAAKVLHRTQDLRFTSIDMG